MKQPNEEGDLALGFNNFEDEPLMYSKKWRSRKIDWSCGDEQQLLYFVNCLLYCFHPT